MTSSSQSSDPRFQRSEAHLRRRDANISRRMSQQGLLDRVESAEASFSQCASQRNPEAHAVHRSLSAVSEEVEEEARFTSLSAGPGGVVLPSDAAVDFFASLEDYKLKPGDPPLTDAQSAEKHADVAKYVDEVAEVRSHPSLEYAVLKALDDQAMEGQADSPHGLWYQMASECHKSIRTMKLEICKHDAAEAAAGAAAAAAAGAYNAGGICTICQDRLPTDASLQTVTACGHAFCVDCFERWEEVGGHRCPNCNQSLNNGRGRGVPQFRPAIADEYEEPQFRPAISDEVLYPLRSHPAIAGQPANRTNQPVEWPNGVTHTLGPYGFGVTADNIGALTPFAPGSLAGRNDDNDTPPHFYPSLAGVPETPEMAPCYRDLPADHTDDEEPSFAGTVAYRGAMFRSANFLPGEDDEPVFVSCGASCGADEPSAKRVCA